MSGFDKIRIEAVAGDMELHCLGHEGMEDSPVARWARELRGALKSDASDGSDKEKPSCPGCHDAADATFGAPKVTRDPAEDVSMSAYDLLPADERDAIAWVREHGGLDYVKREWRSRVPHDRYEQRRRRLLGHIAECETALGRRNQRIEELGHRVGDLTSENAELRRRAMPEGCEWPRYESADLVMFGDCVENRNGTCTVNSVRFYSGGGVSVYGEGRGAQFVVVTEPVMRDPIRKARPKVFAADGEPLEVGQTVWDVDGYGPLIVKVLPSKDDQRVVLDNGGTNFYRYPDNLTHHRPVLDADGVPIKVGDTVWDVEFGCEHVVTKVSDGAVFVAFEDESADRCDPASLTHRAPILAADGLPLRVGETVWDTDAESDTPLTVVEVSSDMVRCEYTWKDGKTYRPCYPPDQLTHTKPEPIDTWERLEEDLSKSYTEYWGCVDVICNRCPAEIDGKRPHERFDACSHNCILAMRHDIVRRARALAERERGE